MGLRKAFLGIIFLVILGILLFSGLYVYSLSKVEIRAVGVNQLQDISLSGFTLGGDIDVYNGGLLTVSVDHVTYKVVLESSGKQLASGFIEGKSVPPKETVSFPFSNKINWVPTPEVAWNLITPGKTYAKISGSVSVVDLGFVEFKLRFEERVDLEQYIGQFAKQKAEGAVDKVKDTVSKIGEGIKSITGRVIDELGKLFD